MAVSLNKNLLGVERSRSSGIKFTKNPGEIRIGIVNLMPFKDEVEHQFFSVLGRYKERVEIEFLYPATHTSKNYSMDYIRDNYYPLTDVERRGYDGIIVTGAPLEELPFEEVGYWSSMSLQNIPQ